MLDFTEQEVKNLYYELTIKEWAKKLGLTMYKANKLTKQLRLKKLPGPKAVPFEFKEEKK